MKIIELSEANLDKLVLFEKEARVSESDIFANEFDENIFKNETLNAIKNSLYSAARCFMCINDDENIIGRLDFSIIATYAFGGDLRAYVDWIYVLKEHRHKGVAQFMIEKFEEYLKETGINEYFLITAENEEAQRFYHGFENAKIEKQGILSKNW